VPLLVLKLVVTPLLVGAASLAARRWGPTIGGLFVALPLTSGPVAFFLAVDQGASFTAAAMSGSLVGLIAIAAFSVGYAVAGPRRGAAVGLGVASAAFVVVGVVAQPLLGAPPWVLFGLVVVAVSVALRAVPAPGRRQVRRPPPRWDLLARMAVGTLLVVGLTAVAPALGPHAIGLAATFPVYVSVLAVFGQHQEGPAAALGVLRGLLAGLYGTAAFFLVIAITIVPLGIAPAFAAAIALTLVIQAAALRRIRAPGRVEVEPEPA
jgi:hypothetical protein